jgi:histidyl-tRNA synthetase
MSKPSIPKGTRDFLPLETVRRQYIFDTIRKSFEKYGYAPIETPAMENLSTLTGKYGEEGDRLIFKILNSGDFMEEVQTDLLNLKMESLDPFIIEKLQLHLREKLIEILAKYFKSDENEEEIKLEMWNELFSTSQELKSIYPNEKERKFYDFYFKIQLKLWLERYFLKSLLKTEDISAHQKITDRLYSLFDQDKENFFGELYIDEGAERKKLVMIVDGERVHLIQEIFKKPMFSIAALRQDRVLANISEKALRYDLTVPFARYVVMNYNELAFPFKRYQIQPVWRADRPQKGRYREFYQCDADVVGSDSLLYEVELIQLFDEVLFNLGLNDFTIKINNRKILSGIAEVAGVADKIIDITVAIDKLDKIGLDGVMKELREREIPEAAITKLQPLFTMSGSNEERLVQLEGLLKSSELGMKGIAELRTVFGHINELPLRKAKLQLDVTLARGLNYYTGAIFEVSAGGVQIGSICGGGRYDDLTGIFGKEGLSGVGISFGADRIYDVLNELKLFPENLSAGTTVLFLNFGEKESRYALKLLRDLRENGISAEIYPEDAKLKKQMKYADAKGVKFVAMAGEDEMSKGEITLKNMKSGEQQKISSAAIIQHLN